MNIIIMGRQAGKTFRLIQLMREDENLIMVCSTVDQAAALKTAFPAYRDRFITYFQRDSLLGRRDPKLLLDNADLFLQWYFRGCTIDTITFDKG